MSCAGMDHTPMAKSWRGQTHVHNDEGERNDAEEMLPKPSWFKSLRLMVPQFTVTLINISVKNLLQGTQNI